MVHHVTDEHHDNYFSIMAAAGLVVMDELSVDAHAFMLTIAKKNDRFLNAVRELAAAAHRAGYRKASEDIALIKDGIAFYRNDGSVVVTVSVGELAERGLPDADVVGVCWGPGEDMCLHHAHDYALKRAATGSDGRGVLIYATSDIRCFPCLIDGRG
jgi:hypothetical protein